MKTMTQTPAYTLPWLSLLPMDPGASPCGPAQGTLNVLFLRNHDCNCLLHAAAATPYLNDHGVCMRRPPPADQPPLTSSTGPAPRMVLSTPLA